MSGPKLTLRQINRATLARQLLLERQPLSPAQALERLAGMQAQLPSAPFVGLWTRLTGFERDDLAGMISDRKVIKATLMRATLHLVTAQDYLRFRAVIQPVLSKAAESIIKQRSADFEQIELLETAAAFLKPEPRTFAELSDFLSQRYPQQDVGALRYTVRTHLPLVQVPAEKRWCYPGNPAFTLAEDWLGQPVGSGDNLRELVLRYLAAFGPASPVDMQTWSGLPGLKEIFQQMRPDLVVYRDEKGHELYDLPDQPMPPVDSPAPLRFLPEFDNLLLSHSDRSRVIPRQYHARIFLSGLRVAAAVLIDGFVGGVWKVEKNKAGAALVIEPFEALDAGQREILADEGGRLLRFIEPDAAAYDVVWIE